jgi:tetratricopeptide (TPR) repeat protein
VSSGERAGVVLGGEPGIGKTRLASELARIVHEQGALVLYGRCDEGLAVPYQPFIEALRPYARAVGPDRLRVDLGELAPDLSRLLPELPRLGEPTPGDPESERFALFEAITALIEGMTREQRALLVLDDLHWAAAPTLLLLRHLLRSERPLGALVLCTYRETELEPGQPLAQLLADLHRDASAERMSIRGLDQPAIAALLEAAVGHPLDQRDSQLANAIGAQTAGNPFFIRELLAHLAESGTLFGADERSTPGATAAQLQAPERLRHVIAQRVARLSAPARRTLRVAAVAAHAAVFSFALLERVLGDRPTLLDALDEAVAAGLLTEAGPGHYVFAHALVRQTIYGQLGSTRRVHVHRQLGEALESLDKPEAYVEALAHHFAHAAADGQADKAADYALAAGRSATSRLGYEEAVAHYERGLQALTLTGQTQDTRRCELLLALGQARWGIGELDNARQAYRQAAELADTIGDATALAHAALGFCGPPRVELAAAVTRPVADLLQRALTELHGEDSVLRARLTARLAAYTDAGHKRMLARQGLEMARRVADKATIADVLVSTHWVTRGPDTPHESLGLARELETVADDIGDQRLQVLAHWWLLDSLLEMGEMEAVKRELRDLRMLAEPRREREIKWLLALVGAGHSLLQGRLEECERLAHEALTHRFEGHDEQAAYVFAAQMVCVRGEQGRLEEIVDTIKRNAEQIPRHAGWCCVLAVIYAQLGRTAQARQEFEVLARNDFCDIPRDGDWLPSMAALSGAAVLLGDAPRAQLLYTLLLPYEDRCVVGAGLLCLGSASRLLGLLAMTLSLYEDAARHFENALNMNARIRAPLWIARTQLDYARMLLLRDWLGDTAKAVELLTKALTTAEELGVTALTERARPLQLAAAEAASSPAGARPAYRSGRSCGITPG